MKQPDADDPFIYVRQLIWQAVDVEIHKLKKYYSIAPSKNQKKLIIKIIFNIYKFLECFTVDSVNTIYELTNESLEKKIKKFDDSFNTITDLNSLGINIATFDTYNSTAKKDTQEFIRNDFLDIKFNRMVDGISTFI